MPKYKVGDVAALFPKPSAPKSDTGKKIQSMFDDFYKNSNKLNKPSHNQFQQKKKQINNKEKNLESPRETKKRKRKHSNDDDALSNPQDTVETQKKQKKPKLDSALENLNGKNSQEEENYFPRNKKKSKHFNSVKENSSAFSKMTFDDGEDESFSQFGTEEHKSCEQKKKKKKLSESETFENNEHEKLKNKSSKKMKKFVNGKNQSEEFDVTNTSAFDETMEEEQSSEKKLKKKKKKKQKGNKIVHKDAVVQDIDPEDIEDQNDDEEPKIKQKFKKMKKSMSSENSQNRDSEKEKKKLGQKNENSEVNLSKKKNQRKPVESAERLSRTLFVGNLPIRTTRQDLQKLFAPFGSIETCRLRGSVPVKSTIPKKVAAIKSEFHAGQKSCIGYVVFKDAKDATDALSLNGELVHDHHIVVNPASSSGDKKIYDEKRSIFIGNLPFDIEDEAIWSAFSTCGHVEAVRAIRDPETGAGKGFGYVLFKNIDSKEAALKLEEIELSGRKIRIKEIKSNIRKSAPSNNNKFNAMRRKAKKLKFKPDGPNSRKSLKKLMNREKRNYQKKKIVNIFMKFST